MAGTSTWWRRLGTALAALILTVLTFGPSLDSLLCHDEGGGLAAAAAELQPGAVAADTSGSEHGDGDLAACVHGHCHHGSPYVPAALDSAATAAEVGPLLHPLAQAPVPTSDLKYSLIRPPRA